MTIPQSIASAIAAMVDGYWNVAPPPSSEGTAAQLGRFISPVSGLYWLVGITSPKGWTRQWALVTKTHADRELLEATWEGRIQ